MLNYMKRSIPDILMCFIMTFTLSITVFSGFYVPVSQASDLLVTGAFSLAVTVAMAMFLHNKNSVTAGVLVIIFAVVGAATYSAKILGQNILRDEESNPFMYYLLIMITAAAVYLLSRSRPGNLILVTGGAVTACLICFLYETEHTICLIVFLCAGIVSQIYRTYMYSVIHSNTTEVKRPHAILTSVIISLLIVALGTGIFYGIIRQLDPPKAELKLITKYMSLEVLDKTGVATTKSIRDPNLKTNQESDQTSTTNRKNNTNAQSGGSSSAADNMERDKNDKLKAIKYHLDLPAVLISIGIAIAAFLLMIIGKIIARRVWFSKLRKKSRKEQIRGLYAYYLKDFGQMNLRRRQSETEFEYAERSARYLTLFETRGTGIAELTEIYDRVKYGDMEPDDEQMNRYMVFHGNFYRNCRRFLGNFRYILKFIVL